MSASLTHKLLAKLVARNKHLEELVASLQLADAEEREAELTAEDLVSSDEEDSSSVAANEEEDGLAPEDASEEEDSEEDDLDGFIVGKVDGTWGDESYTPSDSDSDS